MLRKFVRRSTVCFLVSIVFTLTCLGCSNNNIVYPPVRLNGMGMMELDRALTLSSAFDDSDLVAYIKVGNWVEETEWQTLYNATVVTEYKGTGIKEIGLIQDGSSKGTFMDYPLFTYGNEMLLFLKKAYDNVYYIKGSYSTVLDIVADPSGNYFLIDRCGMLSESLGSATNYSGELQLRHSLTENLISADDIWSEIDHPFDYIFSLLEIEEILQDLNRR